jgi:RNA polymerase sigma factor (TIGR02999 family)
LIFIQTASQVILSPVDDLTRILNQVGGDGKIAADQLLPLVYQKLRQVASDKMRSEAAGHTLQATALVHEAWIRVGGEAQGWQSRWHFFSAAAEAMRRILIDRARSKRAKRHGGGMERVDVDGVEIVAPVEESELLDVHEALDAFAACHPTKAELVKLRYFAGLTMPEAAEVIGISTPTAERHWAFARVWLFREISRKRG